MSVRSTAVIVAAGSGSRMGSDIKKQYMILKDRPVICHTIAAFEESVVDEIILVVAPGEEDFVKDDIIRDFNFKKVHKIQAGGKTRFESAFAGIREARGDIVLVQDGARPFIKAETINAACAEAERNKACIVACKAIDTIKIADDKGIVKETPDREHVWAVQTPQAFDRKLLMDAYNAMFESGDTAGITDDAMVVERFTDQPIHIVEGSYDNIKITTPRDMLVAEEFINS